MKRSDLEHILRASREVTGESDFIVVGSHHKMVRPSRLQKLIDSVADPILRGRLAEALTICKNRPSSLA